MKETVTDTPLGAWFAGALTIAIGLGVASAAFGVGARDEDIGSLERWWFVASGCISIVAGVLAIWKCPRTSIRARTGGGRVVIESRGILSRRTKQVDAASIANVLVAYQVDDDGDEEYQAQMVLRTGERLPLSRAWRSARWPCERHAARVNELVHAARLRSSQPGRTL